ncbi:hypothetical protein ACP70R_014677 [Stipagrostis hirtigluma subsp. patula]
MAADDGDDDVLLLVRQLPVDMEGPAEGRLAHLLPPLHPSSAPAPPPPFRPPPPPAAAASAEPRLSFRGWLGAPRHWDLWVAKLRPLHARLWRRLGIHDAVLASTYRFKRDASAVLHLASFWCPATNTFAFPWGEATLTLQDVALLAGYPALGAPAPAPVPPEWRPDEAALNGVRLGFNRSACKKAHHSAWIKHFLTDRNDAVFEHAAFLALWLTRFVLPGHPESTMRQSVFPIAVRLARGERVALGPAVLASLYRDLRDIKAFLVAAGAAATTGSADMLSSLSLYAPLYILQLWMWERFPALRPGRDIPVRDGEPMAARWHDLSRKLNPTLIREVLSSGDNFVWQPYTTYMANHSGWVRSSDLTENDELRSLAHCLRPSELVGMDCIEQYLPHRVAMQFGLDQDVPGDVPRANQDWVVAWQTYELEGKNVAFFIPHSEPGTTARYAQWWRQQVPPSDLHAGAASVPAEWKTSKRKVKKTPAAMEAEAEKERRMKKARASPSDKKRKLEELYDAKLSDWLAAARDGISDAAGGSCKRGSLPKYDMGSDDALLPNVGTSNDDVVLLVPRKQTTTPAVMPMQTNSITPAISDRGNFIVDKCPDIPIESEGVTLTVEEKKPNIPVDRSLGISGQPAEGATEVMELEKQVSGVSDRPEEDTAPVIEEKEDKVAAEGAICFTGMNTEEKSIVAVTEVDDDNAICFTGMNTEEKSIVTVKEVDDDNVASKQVERAGEEAIEAAPQGQQEVDASVMNACGGAVVLPEVALPIQHTNHVGGCGEVTCLMKDSDVAGTLGTNDGEATCRGFVTEDQREVPCVEEILGGENNQMVEKDSKDLPVEAPQIGVVECVEDITLNGTNNGGEQQKFPPTVDGLVTFNSMDADLHDVHEAENAEIIKDLSPARKDAQDMSMEVAEGEEAEQDQINTTAKGCVDEEHKEFSEVDRIDIADADMHSHFNTDEPEKAAEVIDGAKRQTGRDTDGKIGDVPEVGHADVEKVRELIVNVSDENLAEVSKVEHAKVEGLKGLIKKDTEVSEVEKASELIVNLSDEKLAEVSEVEHAKLEGLKGLMKKDADKKFEKVPGLENAGLEETHEPMVEDNEGRLKEVPVVSAEMKQLNGHERDSHMPIDILQVDLLTRNEARGLKKEDIEDNATKVPQVKHGKSRDEAPIEEDTNGNPCAVGKDLPEKDVDESKKVDNVEEAEGEGCKELMEKNEEKIEDALVVEQAAEGKGIALTGKDIHDHVEEITPVEKVDGQSEGLKRIGTEEITEEITQPQEEGFDKDMIEASKDSTDDEVPCSLDKVLLKGDQMEVSDKGMMEEQCIKDFKLINQREPSYVAAAVKVEGVCDHKTLDTHEELALTQKQDHRIICENKETTMLEDSHMLDGRVKSDWVHVEADETHATGVQNQEILDLDKQLATEERQDLGTTTESNEMEMLQDVDILVRDEFPIDPTGTAVIQVESTEGIQNQERLDTKEMMEKTMECEITGGGGRSLKESNKLGGGGVDRFVSVDVSGSGQNKEACSMEELQATEDKQHHGVEYANEKRILEGTTVTDDQVTEKRTENDMTDGSGRSLQEANQPNDVGLNTSAVAVDVSESTQNEEACRSKEAGEDKQHHGVEQANENQIVEGTSMIDSGELKSDTIAVEVSMAGSRNETLNQCELILEKELAVQEKQDQGTAQLQEPAVQEKQDLGMARSQELTVHEKQDNEMAQSEEPAVLEKQGQVMAEENTKRDLTDIDGLECVGVDPDGTVKMFHSTLPTQQDGQIAGDIISSENKQKEAAFEEHNILEIEGSESNQTAGKEPEGAVPPELETKVEVKLENLENRTEMSICRENDEVPGKDKTSAEVHIAPSSMDEHSESDNGSAEESTKSYDKLVSDPINIACQPIKIGKPSIEEVRRSHNTKSMYLKDIKESLGRIRAEPSNRVQTTSMGYYSRHAVREPISVCKDIKVPLHDSTREYGRDRVSDLAVTNQLEETPRWRQEQYALQILEDVQSARIAEKNRMEMEIRILKAQIAGMERQVMNLDHFSEVRSRSKRH